MKGSPTPGMIEKSRGISMKRSMVIGLMVLAVAGTISAQGMMGSGSGGTGMMGSGSPVPGMMGSGNAGPGMMGDGGNDGMMDKGNSVPGMMDGSALGRGMMGGGMMGAGALSGMMGAGNGMMGGSDFIPVNAGNPLTLDQAIAQARKYLASWGDEALAVSEVTEFSNHFYVEVGEKGSNQKAFELLMNKYTGSVAREPGPNMMWNQKYGPMAKGMMGGLFAVQSPPEAMPVTEAKARELAQKVLDKETAGLKIENGADHFYGYYTLHVLKDGATYGMVGVNGYSGQVWYHSWHGKFIDNREVTETR